METSTKPIKFRGGSGEYIEVARRGDEILGLNLDFIHALDDRCGFLVRFAAVKPAGGEFKPFTHFQTRDQSKYRIGHDQVPGVRLNKLAFPLFQPHFPPDRLVEIADHFDVWDIVASWVKEQADKDGFTISVDLVPTIRGIFAPLPADKFELVLDLPDISKTSKPFSDQPSSEEETVEEDEDTDDNTDLDLDD